MEGRSLLGRTEIFRWRVDWWVFRSTWMCSVSRGNYRRPGGLGCSVIEGAIGGGADGSGLGDTGELSYEVVQ